MFSETLYFLATGRVCFHAKYYCATRQYSILRRITNRFARDLRDESPRRESHDNRFQRDYYNIISSSVLLVLLYNIHAPKERV